MVQIQPKSRVFRRDTPSLKWSYDQTGKEWSHIWHSGVTWHGIHSKLSIHNDCSFFSIQVCSRQLGSTVSGKNTSTPGISGMQWYNHLILGTLLHHMKRNKFLTLGSTIIIFGRPCHGAGTPQIKGFWAGHAFVKMIVQPNGQRIISYLVHWCNMACHTL